jgi:hypothetical protein
MDRIAIFVNDVASARHILRPMLEGAGPTHWVLVACPPKLTRHVGRWVSQRARRQWHERWAAELFGALVPEFAARAGGELETLIATRPLVDVSARLAARLPQLRLLDARAARAGHVDEPISLAQPALAAGRWAAPVAATAGLSLMLTLAD